MIRLCAFLGNPGAEYARNRHNAAWLFLEASGLADGLRWQSKHKGRLAWYQAPSGRVAFLKPDTYMNASGQSLAAFARAEGLAPEEILILHDELELPFGSISLKRGGGLGGHNGLRSAAACLGTRDFLRLRIGIGRPDHDDVAGYVLSDFRRDEAARLEERVFPRAANLLRDVLADGFEAHERSARRIDALAEA
jgi:PTH1 family peptidyl-tRNA hydrolase